MGRMGDIAIEMAQMPHEAYLAEVLGISYLIFRKLKYKVKETEAGFVLSFNKRTPEKYLNQIKGLDNNKEILLEPWKYYEDFESQEILEAIIGTPAIATRFFEQMDGVKKLMQVSVPPLLRNTYYRQLFITVIAALEAFLSESLITLTDSNEQYFRNFVESHKEFKDTKFPLSEIFVRKEKLQHQIREIMLKIMYHNLPTVSGIFRDTFKMKFPEIKAVYKYVITRHDLVHRNGKDKDGKSVKITKDTLTDLIQETSTLVEVIADRLELG